MLKDRKEYPKMMTPRGIAIWPALNEPDYKFKDNGEWHARIRVAPDAPGIDELRDYSQKLMEEAFEAKKAELTKLKKGALLKELKMAPNPVKEELDSETGEPTGFLVLRAALIYKVDIKNGPKAGTSFFKKPDLFDKAGKVLRNPPKIGGGSELKLSVTPMDYETDGGKTIGVSFELNAVQVLTVVAGGERGAQDYGFGEEEGDDIQDGDAQGGFQDETKNAGGGGGSSDGGVKGDF